MARYAHTALNCRDIAVTAAFYARHFGFRQARVVELGGGKQIVFLKNENTYLELFEATGSDPAGVPNGDGHGFLGVRHLAFEVQDVEAFAQAFGQDLKVSLGPLRFDAFIPGWAALWIRDPDDRIVEISQGYQDAPAAPD